MQQLLLPDPAIFPTRHFLRQGNGTDSIQHKRRNNTSQGQGRHRYVCYASKAARDTIAYNN